MSIVGETNISQIMRDLNQVKQTASRFAELSHQLSTGKRYEALRDYGTAVSKIINLSSDISSRESYERSISLVSVNVQTYQDTLSEVDDIVRSLIKLSSEAAPNAADIEGTKRWRSTVETSANIMLKQLTEVMNTNVGGRYIFSGNNYETPSVIDLSTLDTMTVDDAQSPQVDQYQSLNNLPQGTVKFDASDTTKQITIRAVGDLSAEKFLEKFKVQIDNVVSTDTTATASTIVGKSALANIRDNDPTVSISQVDRSAVGEGGVIVYELKRDGGDIAATLDIDVDVFAGSYVSAANFETPAAAQAALGGAVSDYVGFPGPTTFRFAAGETSRLVTVKTADNTTIDKSDRKFSLQLSTGIGSGINIDPNFSAAGGKINDNDSEKEYITVETGALVGADEEARGHVFIIRRENAGYYSETKTVSWKVDTVNSEANTADFGGILPQGQVTFNGNEVEKRITVYSTPDHYVENNENFQIVVEGEDVITARASSTIVNDEISYGISAIKADAAEGAAIDAGHVFRVTRTGEASGPSSVGIDLTTITADASDGLNIISSAGITSAGTTGTVDFAVGQTEMFVTVTSSVDTDVEDEETFSLNLTANPPAIAASTTRGVTNAYLESHRSSAMGTIRDDDGIARGVSISSLGAALGGEVRTYTEVGVGKVTEMTFSIDRTAAGPEEYVSYSVSAIEGGADTHDFREGYGSMPTIVTTDASGATTEKTYLHGKDIDDKDPRFWEQQSVSLRDGTSRKFGVTAAHPAFQKLIKSLLIIKGAADPRSSGQEKIMLDKVREMGLEAQTDVRRLLAENALAVKSIDATKKSHETLRTLAKTRLDDILNVDAAEAAAMLTALQAQVNASYTLISKRYKLSLSNFL